MKQPARTHRKPWRRILAVVGALVVLALAIHPELRVLAPLLDAVGLDTLLVLLGAQLLSLSAGAFGPVLLAAWRRLAPWLSAIDRATGCSKLRGMADRTLENGSGALGQYLWVCWGSCWRLACLGPTGSLPAPARPR